MIKAISKPEPHIQSIHNPHCKLVSQYFYGVTNYIQLVYSEDNNGKIPGLEIYYYPTKETGKGAGIPGDHHYHSRYYIEGKIPTLYIAAYQRLKTLASIVKPGHKLEV